MYYLDKFSRHAVGVPKTVLTAHLNRPLVKEKVGGGLLIFLFYSTYQVS